MTRTFPPSAGPTVPATTGRGRKVWLVAAGALTAVAVLLSSCTMWKWGNRLSARAETQHESYAHSVALVELDVHDGELTLTPGEPGRVTIERRLVWSTSKPTVEEVWTGDTLRITSRCANGPWSLGVDPECSVGYTMRVPPDVAVDARNTSGRTEVRDLRGEVRLSATTGDVRVTGVTGRLSIHTTSGQITGSGLRSAQVDVQVDSGDVDLSFAAPPQAVTVIATTGNVTIDVPGDNPYRVRVDTSTGSQVVGVRHHPDAGRAITVRTTSGDVGVRYAP